MLFHLPLGFVALAAWPGDASATLPTGGVAVASATPSVAAGAAASLPALGIVLAGSPINIFEGELLVLPTGNVAIASGAPMTAAGMSAQLGQTITLPARFGALAETALAAPPLAAETVYGPRIVELRLGAPQFSFGVVNEVTLTFARSLPARFGALAETALAGPPLDADSITGPANMTISGRAPEGFARRRRLTSRVTTS